jgi:DNA-binding transcriptional LysR family regulator
LDLTPRAVELLPQLARGLAELGGTLSGARAFEPATARRSFSVGMADYVQTLLLPPLLRSLAKGAPYVDVSVSGFPDATDRLDDGSVDAAVLQGTTFPKGLSSHKLFLDDFTCMVRKGHPQVPGKRLSMSRYLSLSHVLVSPSGQGPSFVDTELERRGLTRRIALRVASFLIAPQVVSDSDLVSTGPSRLLRVLATRYPIQLLTPPLRLPHFQLQLVWHSRLDHDPAHAWFRRQFIELCRDF